MKNNYLLESEDSLSLEKKINDIIKKCGFEEAYRSIYDLDEVDLSLALEDLDTYGFLSSKKIIIIKNISSITVDDNKDKLDHLLQYFSNPNEDNLVIITDKKLDDRKKFTKDLKKKLEYIKVSFNSLDYIKQELSSYKLETGVVSLLNEYCLDDITKIHNECSKLKDYKADSMEITKNDIISLCVKKSSDITNLSFDFIKAIAKRDKKLAFSIYQELIDGGVDSISMVGLLASQLRIMYQVKVLSNKRMSDKEIADTLGEKSSYRITKTKELINYYSEDELLGLIKNLANIDLSIKTNSVDPNFLIQLLIINL